MPVTIACPKCQTKYKLPESSLGKALKCQKCGAGFKTRAPKQAPAQSSKQAQAPKQAQAQAPKQTQPQPKQPKAATSSADASRQQRAQEMKKLGIDGPLVRQGDIFGPGLPQGAGQLGNFAAEDPGFEGGPVSSVSNVEVENMQGHQQTAQGMESILDNPFVSPGAAGGGVQGRLKKSGGAGDGYTVPKIGMWAVFVATIILLAISIILAFFGLLGRFAPGSLGWLRDIVGAETLQTIAAVFAIVLLVLSPTSMLAIFVGQICCIFSPNKNEKIFASLAVGAIALAMITFAILFLMGVVGGGPGASKGQAIAFGLIALAALFFICIMMLANWFLFISYFKRVGKNLKSKKVVKASTTATLACVGAFAFFIISSIVGAVMSGVLPDSRQTIVDVLSGLIQLITWGVMVTILIMIKTTLDVLKKKKSAA